MQVPGRAGRVDDRPDDGSDHSTRLLHIASPEPTSYFADLGQPLHCLHLGTIGQQYLASYDGSGSRSTCWWASRQQWKRAGTVSAADLMPCAETKGAFQKIPEIRFAPCVLAQKPETTFWIRSLVRSSFSTRDNGGWHAADSNGYCPATPKTTPPTTLPHCGLTRFSMEWDIQDCELGLSQDAVLFR